MATEYPRLRDRDPSACERFVRDHYEGLFRFLRGLGCDGEAAADLTQEAFAGFWASLERAEPAVSPRTWLFAIARNLWRKAARDRRPIEANDFRLVEASGRSPPSAAEDREFSKAVEAAVADLPDDLREVFTLRMWQGFEYAEIGEVQGISPDLARWRYFAARRKLHARLASWDDEREDKHG